MMVKESLVVRLPEYVNQDERLVWRGRHVDTTFLFESSASQYLVSIREGRIEAVRRGPFVQVNWQFALRASDEVWAAFWQPVPAPGFHDLMALLKFKRLTIEGDLYPLMSHLLYFKDVLATLRQAGRAT